MQNQHTLEELIEFVRGKNVYIQTHNFPDPDAIASGFGLQRFLAHYGVPATLCYHGKIDRLNTRKMVELLGIEIVSKDSLGGLMREEDPIICVDSQKHGGNILDLIGDEVAAIDHHPTVKEIEYFYKDVRLVGSCATIIAGYFEERGIAMDAKCATALLYGLKMDTSGFTRGVTDEDIQAFGYLYKIADHAILNRLEQNQMEFRDLKAYGAAISNIAIFDDYGFAFIPFSCPDALIAITCDFLLSIDEVNVAIVYSKRENGIKFSVRSEVARVDAGELAANALAGIGTGGGHSFMAGGFVPAENLSELGVDVDAAIRERFMRR